MAREDVVVGLDIGTTKVCTVIGHGDAQGRITIVGVGLAPSRGLKNGIVVDVDDTVTAIRDSVQSASHMAGLEVHSVVAGVTGVHIQSSNRRGAVTISGEGSVVTEDDVARVMQAAAMDVSRDREIIHSLPRDFAVDGHKGVRRPVGMCGQRLEVEAHIVTGQAGFLQNVVQCVERAGLEVDALVLEPIATSEAVAMADERDLGVALIDIGGGTSDIAVFVDGSIAFSGAIPVGGNHVTRDISIGLRTPFDIAERLKVERGVASSSLIPHGEALEVISAGSGERLRLPRAILGEIIEARMSELFEMSRDAIESAGMQNRLAGGVILTGGGALLPGATELAQQIFDLPVRLGTPIQLSGWSDKVDTPQFATGVGLLRFALRQPGTLGNPLATSTNPEIATTVATAPPVSGPQRRVWDTPVQPEPSPVQPAPPQPQPAQTNEEVAPNGNAPLPQIEPVAASVDVSTNDATVTAINTNGVAPHSVSSPVEYSQSSAPRAVEAEAISSEYSKANERSEPEPRDEWREERVEPRGGEHARPWNKLLHSVRQILGFEGN